MKKRNIAAILMAAIAVTSLTGCGTFISFAPQSTEAPAYIEPEYPESNGSADTGKNFTNEAPAAEACADEVYEDAVDEDGSTYAVDTAEENVRSCPDEASYKKEAFAAEEAAYACTEAEEELALCPGNYWPPFIEDTGENYREVRENEFKDVASSPLSTFGADVDTASYSNLRRMINEGYRQGDIPLGSIRTEELINYFDYDYREPRGKDAFAVNASIIDCPWNKETKLVNLGIKAKELKDTADVPSNIVFLIDVSGSMEDYDKLPLLKMGFDMLVDDLDENDRVSIVTYASSSDIIIAGVPGNEHSRIKRAINSLDASGSTNGGDGIRSAYKLAGKYFIEGGNNRVIMATDGDLNVGVTSEEELEELITEKKENGVFLSVLGFGTGNYNEATLETLADKGNGNYSYIDCLAEAKKVLIDEFNSTLFTVAKDVKFQIEFNPQYVSEYRQVGYENRQMAAKDFNDDEKDGGEIGSGHAMTVMYEIKLNDGRDDGIKYRYQDNDLSEKGKFSDEWMTVSVRYKEPEEDTSKLISFPISKQCYTKAPNCDTLFAAYVAECGMILNESEYTGSLEMSDVAKQISKLSLDDEYKEEFLEMISSL